MIHIIFYHQYCSQNVQKKKKPFQNTSGGWYGWPLAIPQAMESHLSLATVSHTVALVCGFSKKK